MDTKHTNKLRRIWRAAFLIAALHVASTGCSDLRMTPGTNPDAGRVYYLDGAGGGSLLWNWGNEIPRGLRDAGWEGDFVHFSWQTGWGAWLDQVSSIQYKRERAARLAAEIADFHSNNPLQPIHLVGFSAGTAIALYTLEALPESCPVDSVVLLGSSVGAGFDLRPALQRVRGKMYVFTSPDDEVLKGLVPWTGTADRANARDGIAGLTGFRMEIMADESECRLYARVETVDYEPVFATLQHHGRHTGAVGAKFVQVVVAPRMTSATALATHDQESTSSAQMDGDEAIEVR